MPIPYEAKFRVGEQVRIRGRVELENFARHWKYHDPLTPGQIAFAGSIATVAEVGFYHGGDPLYRLEDIPGAWHEVCLDAL